MSLDHEFVPRTLGNYRLIKLIGRGAQGEVYLALNRGGVRVAVKKIPHPTAGNGQRDVRALELIKHLPHSFLLSLIEFWFDNENLYAVTSLADRSLRSCLADRLAPGYVEHLKRYSMQVAEALDYLHLNGVIHRDVKPENILLLGRNAQLGDCGLARQCEIEWQIKATCVGTPKYMALETWRGEPCFASDQYALAVTYAEMRTGRHPFSRTTWIDLIEAHRSQTPDLVGIPEQERQILLRALEKKPEDRYPTCMAFASALQEVADQACLPILADGINDFPTVVM